MIWGGSWARQCELHEKLHGAGTPKLYVQTGTALGHDYQALERKPSLPQALNGVAVVFQCGGEQATEHGQPDVSVPLFNTAAEYWEEAMRLTPTREGQRQVQHLCVAGTPTGPLAGSRRAAAGGWGLVPRHQPGQQPAGAGSLQGRRCAGR